MPQNWVSPDVLIISFLIHAPLDVHFPNIDIKCRTISVLDFTSIFVGLDTL